MEQIILASGSPRRKELLQLLQIPFIIKVSDCDESVSDALTPEEIVMELSKRKARAVQTRGQKELIIGSDTIVVINNNILNKPRDENEAYGMLKKLSNSTHSVFTGVTILTDEKEQTFYEETRVTFYELTDEEIWAYIRTNEPFDKAGAYGIQGYGATLVKSIEGQYTTVVGLPIARLKKELDVILKK